ncbi:MAG: class I SAM-dependent methyltransferase [Acidobacteriota bacterium]
MSQESPARWLPAPLRRYILHFESEIERAVAEFAERLGVGARVLDAGAGEGQYAHHFKGQRYTGVDLGIGDAAWNYAGLDCVGDLERLPFADGRFDGCLNVVTLEHVKDPQRVLCELGRVLRAGGELLVVAPHEWEEHQEPHDYWRFTRYGLRMLLERAGFEEITVEPVGGFFRLLARRLAHAPRMLPWPLGLIAVVGLAPWVLVLPALDGLDQRKNFTLGFVGRGRKRF